MNNDWSEQLVSSKTPVLCEDCHVRGESPCSVMDASCPTHGLMGRFKHCYACCLSEHRCVECGRVIDGRTVMAASRSSQSEKRLSGVMSRVPLPDRWREFLAGQAETGMGFQDVEVTLADGRKVDGIAINGEVFESLIPIRSEDVSSMRVRSGREVGRWQGDGKFGR